MSPLDSILRLLILSTSPLKSEPISLIFMNHSFHTFPQYPLHNRPNRPRARQVGGGEVLVLGLGFRLVGFVGVCMRFVDCESVVPTSDQPRNCDEGSDKFLNFF